MRTVAVRLRNTLSALVVTLAALLALAGLTWAVGALRRWWVALAALAVLVAAAAAAGRLRRRVPARTVLEVDLAKGVVESVPAVPGGRLMSGGGLPVRDLVDAIRRAAGDDRVVGLVARLGAEVALAHAQELRGALAAFRAAGKRSVAFAETFGESGDATTGYYLASGFDEAWAQPGSFLSMTGILSRTPFLRGALDKLGIRPEFDHREEYKAAMYLLTETEMPAPHREATEALTGDQFDQVVAGIAAGRGLAEDAVRAAIDQAPLLAAEAEAAGLLDGLAYRDEVVARVKEATGGRLLFLDRYLKRAGRPHRKGARVALIHATGPVARGRSKFSPLPQPGVTMGADDVDEAFRQATADDAVRAIVFRVDTPGGSAVGSETILRAVVRAREAGKPVVASMATVAASGGYYVSCRADRIVAEPGTVTGSIGVVDGKLVVDAAFERVGLTAGHVAQGANATYFSSRHGYDALGASRHQAFLDDVYQRFRHHVAEGRGLEPDRVRELAKGRVWTGAQAHERGLVDALGGLETALAHARELAGLDPDAPVKLVAFPKRRRRLPWRAAAENSEAAAAAARSVLAAAAPLTRAAAQAGVGEHTLLDARY